MEIITPSWIELPRDLTMNILGRLDFVEILESVQKVCTTWWRVCKDPAMWRLITINNIGNGVLMHRHLPSMFRYAVDLSQGQLIELTLFGFGDDELLNYVVDRSSRLRFLKLDHCYQINAKCLTEAIKRLPDLEELHLVSMALPKPGDIEAIGVFCPMLKSFTFNEPRFNNYYEGVEEDRYNSHALAIARSMPNLRHLQLIGHWMRNEGLEAILDGCPHLQSLSLLNCFDIYLSGDLGRRCNQLMKDHMHPLDTFTSDEYCDIYRLLCDSESFDYYGWVSSDYF